MKTPSSPAPTLSLSEKLIFSLPSFFGACSAAFYNVNYFYYYTNVLNDDLSNIDNAYSISMIFVVLSFPLFGWMLDNTRTRWGRRKPWIALAAPIYYVSLVLIWFPVVDKTEVETLWYGLWNTIYCMFQFLVLTPYESLGVEITPDYNDRSSLFSFVQGFYMCGYILGVGLPQILQGSINDTQIIYLVFSIVNSTLGVLSFGFLLWTIKEPKIVEKTEISIPVASGIRYMLVYNVPFVLLLISITLLNAAPYIISLLPYWSNSVLGLSSTWEGVLFEVLIVTGTLSLPLWYFLSVRNKVFAYRLMLLLGSIGFCIFVIPVTFIGSINDLATKISAVVVCALLGMTGIAMTFNNFLYLSLQGDVIEYDELLTGLRRESQYVNLMQYINWFGSICSITLPFSIMSTLGYISNSTVTAYDQPEEARIGISILIGPAVAVMVFLGLFAMAFYPINQTVYSEIMEGIEAHKKGRIVKDPVSGRMLYPPLESKELAINDEDNVANISDITPLGHKLDFETRWLLYHFSLFELSLVLNGGTIVLVILYSLLLLLPLALVVTTVCLYVWIPGFSTYAPYMVIAAASVGYYNISCFFAALKVHRLHLSNEQIRFHIDRETFRNEADSLLGH